MTRCIQEGGGEGRGGRQEETCAPILGQQSCVSAYAM